jgi:UDP-glucose 4-epimerase
MRVAVTGGAGFIGSTRVDRLLAEGCEVDVIDNLASGRLSNLDGAKATGAMTFFEVDICDPAVINLLGERRPEIIFHLAAQADVRVSIARPEFDASVNVIGSINILEGARKAGSSRVIAAASGGTLYGEPVGNQIPTPESAEQRPLSPYGVSKKSMIDYLAAYQALYGIEFVALALGNVYGPRQDPHGEAGVVAIFAERLLKNDEVVIFGTGDQTRDFVYVDDVVDAFWRASTRGAGLVINIGTGRELSVNDLFSAMAAVTGTTAPAAFKPARPGELLRSCLDVQRAAEQLEWRSSTEFGEGAQRCIEFVAAQLDLGD